VTRRVAVVERDPWDALIASDEIPIELLDHGFGRDRVDRPVTVVLGAAGGVGATLVTCGLALAAAAAGRPVALAELDLERGDIAGAWGVPPERTIDDLTTVIDELMPSHVEMVCHPHASGVWLLLAPRRASASTWWDEGATRLLLRSTRTLGDVVVDAGPSLGPHVQEACRQANRIVLVSPPTIAGARRTHALSEVLETWGVNGDRCLVVNRGVGRDHLRARGFARAVGVSATAELPASSREADDLEAGRWTSHGRKGGLIAAVQTLADDGAWS
jgi:pilus assembly protein CpaE